MILEELINCGTALMAKDKGFDEICQYFYHPALSIIDPLEDGLLHSNSKFKEKGELEYACAPTQGHLQRWLREKHKIQVLIYLGLHPQGPSTEFYNETYSFSMTNFNKSHDVYATIYDKVQYNTYEEALAVGLVKALHLINEKET
jgi:hypothetical protein